MAAVVIGGYYYVAPTLPNAEELRDVQFQIPLRVYSRDGRLMAEFGDQRRTPVAYEDIPQVLIDALIAAEDDRFFEHPGLDFVGTARAVFNFIRTGGERVPGGSTITQQVAREYFLSRELSVVRKFKEWILALQIERELTKEQILELFFNTFFFGQRSYGVVAAARTYFDKDLHELTLSEAAILAGIPQGPSIMNPVSSPTNAAARRAYVLRRMWELGMITDAEREAALAEPILSKLHRPKTELDAPYVAEMVRAEMVRRFGLAAYTAGLRVTTTIDSRLQTAANRAVRQALIAYDERHGYRGPVARVTLPEDEGGDAAAAESEWAALLGDYPSLLGFETALVLDVQPDSARVFLRSRGVQTIGLDAVAWAAPYINDNAVGARPQAVTDVLARGDIVRFRLDSEGKLRLAQVPDVQGAFVSVDPQDGAVVALAGGIDFGLSNFNRAVQSKRQPGSAFKPFVYSAALENGFTTASIVNDAPLPPQYDPGLETVWRPENYTGRWHGETRLREALVESMNLVSVRVVREVGVDNVIRHLRRFGFDDVALPRNLTISLGAGGVSPLSLASGLAAFANGGFRISPYFIQRVEDASGEVLYEAMPSFACLDCVLEEAAREAPGEEELVDDVMELYPRLRLAPQAVTPQNAYLVADMMMDVVRRGTGVAAYRALQRGDLAGKTGTSNDRRDTWFVGFNADVVAAAWVGFDEDRPLGGNEQGGVTAIPMWIEYMREALEGLPEHPVPRPPGIVEVRINPETGLVASDARANTIFERFEIDRIPEREPDPVYQALDPGTRNELPARSERIF
ncbi:MAG TPA: penicillin-binding protein 1A [Gammaproteobacteria bacterium]